MKYSSTNRRVPENSAFFVALTRLTGREHLTSPTFLINMSPQCLYAWKYFASAAACIQKTQRHFTNRNELSLTVPLEGAPSVFCTRVAQSKQLVFGHAGCLRPSKERVCCFAVRFCSHPLIPSHSRASFLLLPYRGSWSGPSTVLGG